MCSQAFERHCVETIYIKNIYTYNKKTSLPFKASSLIATEEFWIMGACQVDMLPSRQVKEQKASVWASEW